MVGVPLQSAKARWPSADAHQILRRRARHLDADAGRARRRQGQGGDGRHRQTDPNRPVGSL